MRRHKQTGFTLVELLIAITIIGILLAIGLPSFQRTIDKSRLVGAADNLLADMRYALTEATKRNIVITITFTEGANWSYVFPTSSTTTKTTNGSDYRGTSMLVSTEVSASDKKIFFDPKRSTLMLKDPITGDPIPLTSATTLVTITSALGAKLGLEVDPLSRMRLCTSTGVGGYPTCP
jgi:type IV fimbrial biogenesis protein FimT